MSAQEYWAFLKDGKIYLHVENDGADFLAWGAQASDTEISIGKLASTYPTVFERFIAEQKAAHRQEVLAKHGLPPDYDTNGADSRK